MTSPAFPPPPVHDADLPAFAQVDWPRFELMAADLLQEEDGVVNVQLHGTPGPQTDHGVDAIGFHADGSVDLVSCKRYPTTSGTKLAKWSQEMLDHWDSRWSGFRVRRFIIATAATNLAKIENIDQISSEGDRFRAIGIRYEAWGPHRLKQKLRPHRQLTANYLGSGWADIICGPIAAPDPPVTRAFIDASFAAQISELQRLLSGDAELRAESAVEDMRRGNLHLVSNFIREMRRDQRWPQLSPQAQSRILRLEGSLAVLSDDLDAAERLDGEAEAIHPAGERRLAARIAAERGTTADGLMVLGSPSTVPGRQLQAALLLSAGQQDAARSVLQALQEDDPDDAETLRLAALERLGSGARDEAISLIHRVELLAGEWLASRRAGALVRYASAVSPALGAQWLLAPNPFHPAFVKRDEGSQRLLREALDRFARISAPNRLPDDDIWQLAILCNISGERENATMLAREILARDPGEPVTIGWVLVRDLDVDLSASRTALEVAYERGADLSRLNALAMLIAEADGPAAAIAVIERDLNVQTGDVQLEAKLWIARLRGDPGDDSVAAIHKAQTEGLWDDLERVAADALAQDPPHTSGLMLAEMLTSNARWSALSGTFERLLAYGTGQGVRLAAYAALNNGFPGRAAEILEQHSMTFGPVLPHDLQQLRNEALARSGRIQDALRGASSLAVTGTFEHLLHEAELRARVGDVRPSIPVIKRALAEDKLDAVAALQWSQLLRAHEPDLSRKLTAVAVTKGIDERWAASALNEALTLGLEKEVGLLMPLLGSAAERGDLGVRMVGIEEFLSLSEAWRLNDQQTGALYRQGAIPVHLYARGDAATVARRLIARVDHRPYEALIPRLTRHGGRPAVCLPSFAYDTWHIHLDITGLVEAHNLGLLDAIEGHPNGLSISSRLPATIQQSLLNLRRPTAETIAALELADKAICDGVVLIVEHPATDRIVGLSDADGSPQLGNLARMLVDRGAITPDILADIGEAQPIDAVVDDGAPVCLSMSALIQLAATGWLHRVAAGQPLQITPDVISTIRNSLAGARADQALFDLLTDLQQRVGTGVVRGVYKTLPLASELEADASFLDQQLGDLLSAPNVANGVLWADDRNLTGYVNANSLNIVGALDVVGAMQASGALSALEAARCRRALRSTGAALIPFEVAEIVIPLAEAPIVDGAIMETEALRAVRRALAATRTLDGDLKIGPADGLLADRPDEFEAARSMLRIFPQCLFQVWDGGPASIAARIACSDWLLGAVRVRRLFRDYHPDADSRVRSTFDAMEVADCFEKAYDIGGPRDERSDLRLNYLNWCWQRLIVPRLGRRTDVIAQVADYITDLYRALIVETGLRSSKEALYMSLLLRRHARAMPDPISSRVISSEVFPALVRTTRAINLGRHQIEPGRFWRAVRAAYRYGNAKARTQRRRQLRFQRVVSEIIVTGVARARVSTSISEVIGSRPKDRGGALASFAADLDLASGPTEQVMTLRHIDDPDVLARQLLETDEDSVIGRFRRLEESLATRRGATIDMLRPATVDKLVWHFRQGDTDFVGQANAWAALVTRDGAATAHATLAASPSSLPDDQALAPDQVTLIIDGAITPLALVAAARLARACGHPPAAVTDLTERFVRSNSTWGELQIALLRWTLARMSASPGAGEIDRALLLRLCWLHADRLLEMFMRHQFAPDQLIASFEVESSAYAPLDRQRVGGSGPINQADPSALSPACILYHGLARIFGSKNLNGVLPKELVNEIEGALRSREPDGFADLNLLLRHPEYGDALDGFMTTAPVGLFVDRDAVGARSAIICRAFDALRLDARDRGAWLALIGCGMRGVSPEEASTLIGLLAQIDLFDLAGFGTAAQQPHVWRGTLGPLAWHGEDCVARLEYLALRSSVEFGDTIASDSPAENALDELVETALSIARTLDGGLDEARACDCIRVVCSSWPAAVPRIRTFILRLLDGTEAERASPFWQLGNDLNAM
jgi:hypothetical protein